MILKIVLCISLVFSSCNAIRDSNQNAAYQGDDPDAVPLVVVVDGPPVAPLAQQHAHPPQRNQNRQSSNTFSIAAPILGALFVMGSIWGIMVLNDRGKQHAPLPPVPTPTPDPCLNADSMCEQLENDMTLPQGGYWINVKCGCNKRWKYVNCSTHHHTTTLITTAENNTLQMTTTVSNNTATSETMNPNERVLNRRLYNGSAVCDVPGPPFNETLFLNTTTFIEMITSLVESTLPHTHDDLPPLLNSTTETE